MTNSDIRVQELVHNDSFCRLVHGTASEEEMQKWNHWIDESEVNREIARQAITEIVGFDFNNAEHPNVSEEWVRLKKRIDNGRRSGRHQNRGMNLRWIYRIAAVLAIGVLAGVGYYFFSGTVSSPAETKKRVLTTASNERETISFSRGAKIVLNGNSKLTYQPNKRKGESIDVMLNGEAYFSSGAARGAAAPVFKVHTPDGIIEDIGTKFFVKVAPHQSQVVLQQGRVAVQTRQKNDTPKIIHLTKNEMLLFGTGELAKKKVNATFYTSWATGFMQFDHTSIKKFAHFVEQRFDVRVEILDPALSGIKLDGSIYYKTLAGLVGSVSKVAGVPAYESKDRKTVYIGSVNNSNKNN